MKNIFVGILLSFVIVVAGCSKKNDTIVVSLETTQGKIDIKLLPKVAPKTVENFTKLVTQGYYDGLIFHRVIKNFMIQSGDPTGTGAGGDSIWGKPFEDEFKENVVFDKTGVLAMANRGPNTNGSQFFITTVNTPWLNGRHTIFGYVTKESYDVVKKIEAVQTSKPGDRPIVEQKIIKAYINK
ncbi:MAG: peptidylprolyl isomerase [Campylobacteraceae bacterium 4484_166]|nr:MAG: peptidylprolyl isomerase [Campylobacteraceae bacterium 4484_166]